MPYKKLILGPPGTGKTTRLIGIVEKELAAGVSPDRIAYISFTNVAATEARDRACKKFGFETKQLPHFRTIHSLAFKALGLTHSQVINDRHYKELGEAIGLRFDTKQDQAELLNTYVDKEGDLLRYIDNLSRLTGRSVEDVYSALDERDQDRTNMFRIRRYIAALEAYKRETMLFDFTDFLTMYDKIGEPLEVDVFIVDEAQDLSLAQWKVVEKAASKSQRMYIGGDDEQCIFEWAGADLSYFLNLAVDEREVLERSYRLPRRVFEVATATSSRIQHRYAKDWHDNGEPGLVTYENDIEGISLARGTFLLLARNTYQLRSFEEFVRDEGYRYSFRGARSALDEYTPHILAWEQLRKGETVGLDAVRGIYALMRSGVKRGNKAMKDAPDIQYNIDLLQKDYGLLTTDPWYDALDKIPARDLEYIRGVLRRGDKLTGEPRIRIDTIHGVKGMEADTVVIKTDISRRTHRSMHSDPDAEHRVFYVGFSRAKKNMHIIVPQTSMYYAVT